MLSKYYICKHCGNLVEKVNDAGVPLVCCGEKMHELTANTTDAAVEKHVPVLTKTGDTVHVSVGSALHPMTQEHHIAWIALYTQKGMQRVVLDPLGKPEAVFALTAGDSVVCALAYCNLHGLWMAQ